MENTRESVFSTNADNIYHTLKFLNRQTAVCIWMTSVLQQNPLLYQCGLAAFFFFSRDDSVRQGNHLECRRWQEIPRALCVWRWQLLNLHGEKWQFLVRCQAPSMSVRLLTPSLCQGLRFMHNDAPLTEFYILQPSNMLQQCCLLWNFTWAIHHFPKQNNSL